MIQQRHFIFLTLLLTYVLSIQSRSCVYNDFKWKANISTALDACNIFEDLLTVNLSKLVDVGSVMHAWIKVNNEPRSWGSLEKVPLNSITLKLENKCLPILVEI